MLAGGQESQKHQRRVAKKPMFRERQLQQWMLSGIEVSGRDKSCTRILESSGLTIG